MRVFRQLDEPNWNQRAEFHIHSLDLARNLGSDLCIRLASRALRYQKLVVANEALVILTNLWEIQD